MLRALFRLIGFAFAALSLVGCFGSPRRLFTVGKVRQPSGLVGKQFTTGVPLVYIKNVPHFKDVDPYVANNSLTMLTRETSYQLDQLRNSCGNCLDKRTLVTKLRVEIVPIGTPLTVVDEHRYVDRAWPVGGHDIHFLLVEDDNGNLSEISKLGFELRVIETQNENNPWRSKKEVFVRDALEILDQKGSLQTQFCFPPERTDGFRNTNNLMGLEAFIKDFELNLDIQFTAFDHEECALGAVISYQNADAFMTANYYFIGWGLYGDQIIIE